MRKIFLLLLGVVYNLIVLSQETISLERINETDGLPSNIINCVFKDSRGFLWIGSVNGLFLYDGNRFISYAHIPSHKNIISNNHITSIAEDSDSNLWVGTHYGLNRYVPEKDELEYYLKEPGNKNSLSHSKISCLMLDSKDNFWIGTREGLNKLVSHGNSDFSFNRYYPVRHDSSITGEWAIQAIIEDNNHDLMVGTWEGGLQVFNSDRNHFITIPGSPNIISSFARVDSNTFWIGTYDKGIYKFNADSYKFTKYSHLTGNDDLNISALSYDSNKRLWIGTSKRLLVLDTKNIFNPIEIENKPDLNNEIPSIYNDNTNIWISSKANGIYQYNSCRDKFSKYMKLVTVPGDNHRDYFSDIAFSNDTTIWLATHGDGLVKTNSSFTSFKRYLADGSPNSLSDNIIKSIIIDATGKLWLATDNGLDVFDPVTGKTLKHYYHNPSTQSSLNHNSVYKLIPDDNNNLWVLARNMGIHKINLSTGKFVKDKSISRLKYFGGTNLFIDKRKNIWMTGGNGLLYYNSNKDSLRLFHTEVNNPNSITDINISSVYQDSDENIWIGTNNGLNKIDFKTCKFTHLFVKDGLASNIIYDMQEDDQKRLWIRTSKGISFIDLTNGRIENFTVKDGLDIMGSFFYHDKKTGNFILPKEKGLYIFHPDSINECEESEPLYFTGLKIAGKTIKPGSPPLDNNPLKTTKKITLPYNYQFINLTYSKLKYFEKDIKYEYKLEGFNEGWIYNGTANNLAFMNLKPGNYLLKVRSVQQNFRDEEYHEATLGIKILPPWWRSWWSFLSYALLIAAIILAYRRFLIIKEARKNKLHLERMKAQKIHEIDQLKLQFYFDISHELRTPLTLILDPLEKIKSMEISSNLRDKACLAYSNAKRLNSLMDQILDLRKIEIGKSRLEIYPGNIGETLTKILSSFISNAEKKNIDFKIYKRTGQSNCWFDPDKLEKVISNLLTNAFKYTPSTGKVHFSAVVTEVQNINNEVQALKNKMKIIIENKYKEENGKFLIISVQDSGKGINEDEINKVFERYYQSKSNHGSGGSGIGLSLTKELVELMHGYLFISSNTNGTLFKILIPMDKEKFMPEEIITEVPCNSQIENLELPIPGEKTGPETIQKKSGHGKENKILLIEDNEDLLKYLSDFLQNEYVVYTAKNGKEGYEMALKKEVDLIVSDIMMPVMDGLELCKTIKNNEITSHIPVILLTAKGTDDSKIEGIEFGADDYITKPFNADLLITKICNLIETRRLLRKKFMGSSEMIPQGISLTSKDELFLSRSIKIIEDNISSENFTQEDFCKQIGMSRSQVYRKLKILTNQSLNEFIRVTRLKKSAQILEAGKLVNIAELAYTVGFTNHSYFTSSFKKLFGLTPKEYNEKFMQIENDSN